MSDEPTYPVSGQVEFYAEQAFVDVLKYDETIAAVFQVEAGKVNIRRRKDTTKGDRTMPALAVGFFCEQSIPRTNEYHARGQIFIATQADSDKDGQQAQAIMGAVRDCMHQDDPARFPGNCEGFLKAVNEITEFIVFHQIHELAADPEDSGRSRKPVINVDAWLYPGRASE